MKLLEAVKIGKKFVKTKGEAFQTHATIMDDVYIVNENEIRIEIILDDFVEFCCFNNSHLFDISNIIKTVEYGIKREDNKIKIIGENSKIPFEFAITCEEPIWKKNCTKYNNAVVLSNPHNFTKSLIECNKFTNEKNIKELYNQIHIQYGYTLGISDACMLQWWHGESFDTDLHISCKLVDAIKKIKKNITEIKYDKTSNNIKFHLSDNISIVAQMKHSNILISDEFLDNLIKLPQEKSEYGDDLKNIFKKLKSEKQIEFTQDKIKGEITEFEICTYLKGIFDTKLLGKTINFDTCGINENDCFYFANNIARGIIAPCK